MPIVVVGSGDSLHTPNSNWLVDRIVDKETDMISMRKQFLGDGKSKQEDDNYEFKGRDRDDRLAAINGTSD